MAFGKRRTCVSVAVVNSWDRGCGGRVVMGEEEVEEVVVH